MAVADALRAALAKGDLDTAESLAQSLLVQQAERADSWHLAAIVAMARGDLAEAFKRLAKALARNPRLVAAWSSLGELYHRTHQVDQAVQSFYRAITVDDSAADAWNGMGVALAELGRHAEANDAFRQALARDGGRVPTRLNLISSLLSTRELQAALQEADKAVAGATENADVHFVRGTVLVELERTEDAVAAWRRALELNPAHVHARFNLALALDELGDWTGAAQACELALRAQPDLHAALAQLTFLKRRLCDWDHLDDYSARLRTAVREGAAGITPFSFLSEPATPGEQLQCARRFAELKLSETESLRRRAVFPARGFGSGRPRVGFISSGFNNHPTALLIVELIERLRTGGLVTIGLATTRDDGGALRRRLRAAFHEFIELHSYGFEGMAGRIYDARIDVLIDLRGYGGGGVTEVLALRPAPIQVNWLAYPGTSGAPFIDYLIADRHVVPAEQREHYSETLVRLPHAFQPSDSTRTVGMPPARRDCGLPEHGCVFASFNNSYKISPQTFAVWTRILRELPDSVLWLLAGKDEGAVIANLRAHAERAGIDPVRLVFQRKLPHDEYLTRYAHVDLFLDTWPYGAHTTANDALWAGCPVLTLPGDTFASRVAGSLLQTLGMPELIARDTNDYVAKAIVIGRSSEARGKLRSKLAAQRQSAPLFDMRGFAIDFERAIVAMVDRARRGLKPVDINLDTA